MIHSRVVAVAAIVFFVQPAFGAEWQSDWDRTLNAAQQEGEIVVYSTNSTEPVFREVFQKKFPKIKVTTVTGRGFQLGQKVLAERRAGKFIRSEEHTSDSSH